MSVLTTEGARVGAVRASGRRCLDDAVGVLGQRAGHAGTPDARLRYWIASISASDGSIARGL